MSNGKKIYYCVATAYFNVRAESEAEAQDWLDRHRLTEILRLSDDHNEIAVEVIDEARDCDGLMYIDI